MYPLEAKWLIQNAWATKYNRTWCWWKVDRHCCGEKAFSTKYVHQQLTQNVNLEKPWTPKFALYWDREKKQKSESLSSFTKHTSSGKYSSEMVSVYGTALEWHLCRDEVENLRRKYTKQTSTLKILLILKFIFGSVTDGSRNTILKFSPP